MSHDDITQMFENITPQDLILATNSEFLSFPCSDDMPFDAFVELHWGLTQYAFAACDGRLFPVITIQSGDKFHFYKAHDGELMGDFVERVQSSSALVNGSRMYFYKKVRAHLEEDGKPEQTVETVYWLAGDMTGGQPTYRHGYFQSKGQTLGPAIEADAQTPPDDFRKILERR